MKNALAVATLVALFTMSAPALVGGADAASDVERAKQQTLIIPDLQKAADAAARFKNESVETKSTSHQITIAVVNSKLNDGVKNRPQC